MFAWIKSIFTSKEEPKEPIQDEETNNLMAEIDDFIASYPPINTPSFPGVEFNGETSFSVNSLPYGNDFFIFAAFSPDKEWLLGVNPGHGNFENNKREWGEYVLLNRNGVQVHKALKRPFKGYPANNGTFVIEDKPIDLRSNTFYVFSATGEQLIRKKFNCNIQYMGISHDGYYAFCQSANYDIFIFDLNNKKLLRRIEDAARADNYEFDVEKKCIYIPFNNLRYRYLFQGGLWEDGNSLFREAKMLLESIETMDAASLEPVITMLNLAEKQGVSPGNEAKISRLIGELYYKCGDYSKAIQNLTFALKSDPKCGAKKLLAKIKAEKGKI